MARTIHKALSAPKNLKDWDDPARFFDGRSFRPALLAAELIEDLHIIATPVNAAGMGAMLYVYQPCPGGCEPGADACCAGGGYYHRGEEILSKEALRRLGSTAKNAYVEDVLNLIRRERATNYDDLNVDACRLINVTNGMLDWRTGEIVPHDPKYRSTVRIPVRHDPGATSDLLLKTIRTWIGDAAMDLFLEMIGYFLIPTRKHQRAFLFIGDGANGKSTAINLIRALIGPDNVSSESLHDLEDNRFRSANLVGKHLNVCADLDQRALACTGLFKKIVGDDTIPAERKNQQSFEFDPKVRLLYSANKLPRPKGDRSYGFFRRWILVPFENKFTPDGVKPELTMLHELTTPESLSALLNLAIGGLRRLEERGEFNVPESSLDAAEEYRRESDITFSFVSTYCRPALGAAPLGKTELYTQFRTYCENEGIDYIPTAREFAQQIKSQLNPRETKKRIPPNMAPVHVWLGVECTFQTGEENGDVPEALADGPSGVSGGAIPALIAGVATSACHLGTHQSTETQEEYEPGMNG